MKTSSKVLAMLLALALSVSVWAQTRKFPEQSKLGWLQVTVFPVSYTHLTLPTTPYV